MFMAAVVVGGLSVLCLATEKSRKLSLLFIRFVVAYIAITLEDGLWNKILHLPGPLPRDLDEVRELPIRLQGMLHANSNVLKEGERVVKIVKLPGISSEPAKQRTAGSLMLYIFDPDTKQTRELAVFCKFQTGRGMPRYMQAIRWAAEYGVCREVDFYNEVRGSVPVKTAEPLMCVKSPLFNYVFIVLEHIPLTRGYGNRVVNDYDGATVSEVEAMMQGVAKIHRRFAGGDSVETAWIPAKQGLDFAKWVETFLGNAVQCKAYSLDLWFALKKHFENKPVTMVHGDCRPGNMIFHGIDRNKVEDLVFSDWEATNIAPFLWDFTYCTTLGWSAKARRENQSALLDKYLDALHVKHENFASRDDLPLLVLVLAYVSRTIRVNGFWANQGNTTQDQVAWLHRVEQAIADLDAKQVAEKLKTVTEEEIRLLQQQTRQELDEILPSGVEGKVSKEEI